MPRPLPTQAEFRAWADGLEQTHPEMFGATTRRRTARAKWHPIYQRVYGIRPWEMGRYTLREVDLLSEDLEKNGLGF